MIKYLNNTLASIKIKINDLFFFLFIILFVALLIIVKADLLGSFSLISVALITFYFSKYYKSLATILYVALCVRLVLIFLGNFLVTLPDSWGDATLLEHTAWEMSQDGFFALFYKFPSNNSSFFISWIIAFFYSLTDRSIIMGQSLSLFFFLCSVLLGTLIASKIWSEKISMKVGWIIAVYPTLVLYSSLILREAFIWFFLLVAIYGIVCWSKDRSFKSIIIFFVGFFGASLFHGGMIIGGFIFLIIYMIISLNHTVKRLSHFKVPINSIAILILTLISINYAISN